MFCILLPGLLLPMLALKMDRVEKKGGKKLKSKNSKLAPFYNKHLKSTGAKALSALALISDNTVPIITCRTSNVLPLVNPSFSSFSLFPLQ